MSRWTGVILGLVGILALGGCARATVEPLDRDTVQRLLPFLKDGWTTQSEIYEYLGKPLRSFDDEGVITYRLKNDGHQFIAASKDTESGAPYELVLVFDQRHILQRSSLLRLW